MEEERIGPLYVRLFFRRLSYLWESMFPRGLSRSPWLPVIVVGILILGPGFGWYLHRHGRFSTLKREIRRQINSAAPSDLDAGRPGGQDPLLLTRKQTAGSDAPEFLSATLLPGLGMEVLQITANLPGRGEAALLASPTVQAVAGGAMEPPNGFMDDHGAIELPWGGIFMGATTPVGTSVIATWRGHSIEESTDGSTRPDAAEGGTLVAESADGLSKTTTPDGMQATAVFKKMNTDDRWPSKTDVMVSAHLEARTIDLAVTAKNTGDQEEPMGIGWHPRFRLGADGRKGVQLQLPNGQVLEITNDAKNVPSGQFTQAPADVRSFQGQPAELGSVDLTAALVGMKPLASGHGPSVELRNPTDGYGIRITAVTSNIRELHVVAPMDAAYVTLGMQSNLDDPLGKEWNGTPGGSIAVLKPGESTEWHVRLEIFPVVKP